jgi:hypothetical protein
MELPGGFATQRKCQGLRLQSCVKETYEGSVVLLVDMSKRLVYESEMLIAHTTANSPSYTREDTSLVI